MHCQVCITRQQKLQLVIVPHTTSYMQCPHQKIEQTFTAKISDLIWVASVAPTKCVFLPAMVPHHGNSSHNLAS